MSEIYEALRDAERQKGASRRTDTLPAPIDAPFAASAPATLDASVERKSSLIRGVRGRLERLKAKGAEIAQGEKNSQARGTAGGERDGAAAGEDAADPMNSQPSEDVSLGLLRELAALEGRFVAMAEQLTAAVDELRAGRPAAASLGTEVTDCQSAFDALRKRVAELAPSAALAETATSPSATLNELLAVLQSARESERQRRQFEETRLRAAAELEQVLRLVHGDGTAFSPLDRCQNQAQELRARLAQAECPNLPDECRLLAERQHTFSRLLDLVERGDDLSDEDWEAAEEAVSSTFGKPLAIAIARGRLRLESGAGRSA